MALGDYILCCKCERKLLYDGDRSNREWWVDRWGKDPAIVCPACESKRLVPLSEREIELIDGMIEVQLHHAAQCDGIANRVMAERQKGWDMERVELLRKLRGIGKGEA